MQIEHIERLSLTLRLLEGARLVESQPEVLPEQVHTVSSSSSNDSDRQMTLGSDNNTQNLVEENCHIQTDSLNGEGTEMITESDEEDVALEPWLSFEDPRTGMIGYSSESDIDQISEDEDDVIPPSRMEDVEFWDIFSCDENNLSTTEPLAVPAIGAHAKHPDMKLCVVKLFRNKTPYH
ncbi:uncharacterized protein LOC117337348 isoform X2 [Pecten maximus]|uniref:uncharacterized protein LOC117337348 isoform X2 n=1 Tax=Pecten maximus TaxID=6579 RepID=UPI0014587463|nr:uncharacterized protein LOC117337348 isoform X2 [Pecten maximus]